IVNFVMADGSVRTVKNVGRNETNPSSPMFHVPPTSSERAFIAASGFSDGDATREDGVNN
ncbi:MAG TPA: H-X9-DG-CTERM domain-containing protein, partial [Gemmataceae bacterium]|nr:H-X9-DG-CTERM domain-containing protein [Gemmataceae bacterium]